MCVCVCVCVCVRSFMSMSTSPLTRSLLFRFFFFFLSQAYKRKTEAAKKEYLKALAAYRASLVSKVTHMTHRPWLKLMMDWMENPC